MIRIAKDSDFENINKLWYECFTDAVDFSKWYFNNKYNNKYNWLYDYNSNIIAMAQAFPRNIKNIGKVTYLYGCCTSPAYRNKGIMSKLIKHTFNQDIKNNIKASILVPETASLFNFYKKYGYDNISYISEKTVKYQKNNVNNIKLRFLDKSDINAINSIYENKVKDFYFVERNSTDWLEQINLFKDVGGKSLCIEYENKIAAYAFLWFENDNLYIQECVGLNSKFEEYICLKIMEKYNKTSAKVNLINDNNTKPLGCIKIYSQEYRDKQYFMNLMFN